MSIGFGDSLLTFLLSEAMMFFAGILLIGSILIIVRSREASLRRTCGIFICICAVLYLIAILALSFLFSSKPKAEPEPAPPSGISVDIDTESDNTGTRISGCFTATVRDTIPDYVSDDTTPQIGILTLYQDAPFTAYLGKELCETLEAGQTYVFSIETINVGVSITEIHKMSLPVILYTFNVRITDTRPAQEHELGTDSLTLTYE